MSESVVQFRGEIQSPSAGTILVETDLGARLEIAGTLTDAVLRVARLAARPLRHDELVAALECELTLDDGVAAGLIAQLLDAGLLACDVATSSRLQVEGQSVLADELRTRLAAERWPADVAGVDIVVLGRLGTTGWHDELTRAVARGRPALSCSFEASACWIGPVVHGKHAPCPLCLHARRVAARSEVEAAVVLSCPPRLALVSALLREVAESFARGDLGVGQALHVDPTGATWHTLLPQPRCALCDAASDQPPASLDEQAQSTARQLAADLTCRNASEPSEAQRAAFVDPLVGPLRLELYDAEAAFRALPLVLGSLRTAVQVGSSTTPQLMRREYASVLFGTGATERQRRLVAFAEGIERYAGATDAPDLLDRGIDELAPHALHPHETVRFSAEQYAALSLERYSGQPTDWSWACDWTSGHAKLLIHDAFSFVRRPGAGSLSTFHDPFSSGMAAHRSVGLALQRAVFELIERDAFMLAWYLKLPLTPLDTASLDDAELDDMLRYLRQGGVSLTFHDLRVDFSVPCVLAVARAGRDFGPWRAGGTILSASAGLTFRDAVRHAVREVLGHYTVFALVSPDGDKSIDPHTGETRPWWPAFAAMLSPRADQPLAFLGAGEPLRPSQERPVSMADVRAELLARGVPVFVRRLGRRDVRSSGLTAVRAVAPGLVRLTASRESANFGEPRIASVAAQWGVPHTLNPMPHPLA